MIFKNLFGMRFTPDGLTFSPDVALLQEYGVEKLTNLRYLNGRLDITISGKGSKLASVKVNGKTQSVKKPIAPADGITHIELILD